jgi:sulfate/thiosulfate transport system ATP-binding protein
MTIAVRDVSKWFGGFQALKGVSLDVPAGEVVALLGPSGSGKTTLLRIVAGLEAPDAGAVFFHGEDATARHVRDRRVGFVFQHYALFRHMTVFENVAFGLRVRPRRVRPAAAEIRRRVHDLLRLVQLDGLATRYPGELSGGQRQRVALARALAVEPGVLLLDEPFGSLDARVRRQLRRWLRRLHDEIHVTSIFVTHDQEEALEVADRVVVMNDGRVEHIGTPEEVYDHPASDFVYHFLGDVNLFHGRLVRPHDVELARTAPSAGAVLATVRHVRAHGAVVRLELDCLDEAQTIEAEVARDRFLELALRKGDQVYVAARKARVSIRSGRGAAGLQA